MKKFNPQKKFYIAIAVLLVALVIAYPYISSAGEFVRGSRTLPAVEPEPTVKQITPPEKTTETCVNVLDQEQPNMEEYYQVFKQSFIPTYNKLTKVDLYIPSTAYCGSEGCQQILQIKTSLSDPSISQVIVSIPSYYSGWFTFDIPDVSVTPGTIYYMQFSPVVNEEGGYTFVDVGMNRSNPYPNGIIYLCNAFNQSTESYNAAPDIDIAFKIYGCEPYCGDGTCNVTETCETCPIDCGECPPGYRETKSYVIDVSSEYGNCNTFCTDVPSTDCVNSIISGVYSTCSAAISNNDYCICTASPYKTYNPAIR